MLLKPFSLALIASFALYGGEDILSSTKKNTFDLKRKQTIINSDIEKRELIGKVIVSVDQSTDTLNDVETDTTTSTIAFSQDIFKSGGIYYAVQYANAKKDYGLNSVKYEKNQAIVSAYTILYSIKKLELQIEKQKLLIANQDIDIRMKKEQYLAGIVDSSFLNNAIIVKTSQENTLLDLQTSRDKLIEDFKNISDLQYTDIALKPLFIPAEQEYFDRNLELKTTNALIEQNSYYKNMVVTKYLPTVTFDAYYAQVESTTTTDRQGYGLTVSMPFGVNTFNDIETSKINVMLARNQMEETQRSERNFYNQTLENIKRVEKKRNLALEDLSRYDALIAQVSELLSAQMKTSDDLTIMQNSKKIREIDLKIYDIDRELEILPMYGKMDIDI